MVRFNMKIFCKGDFIMQKQEEGELSQDTKVIEKIREKLDLPKPEEKSKEVESSTQVEKKEEEKTIKGEDEKKEEKTEFTKTTKNSKKEMKKMDNTPKKKWVKPVIILLILAVIILIFSTIFAIMNINSDKIISGISINNIEVSGLTKEEAKGKLEAILNEKITKCV